MGSRLRRELREALPASIKGLQRAVALEIADDARYDDQGRYDPENGRCSRVRLSDLVRWTGAKDELSVREMLRRMAVAGWEFRQPIGKGKDGRPLYAVPGQAMQFRVPDFEAPTTVGPYGPEGPTTVGATGAEGPTVVEEGPTTVGEGPTVVAEGPTTVGPPSQEPPPASHRDPTSSSPVPSADAPAVAGTEGGCGGDPDLRSIAEHITAHLDYRGKPPDKRQRKTICDRLAAALGAGWTVNGLALYLDLGEAKVDSPAAIYAHRLHPDRLPDPEPPPALPPPGGVRGELPTAAEIEALTIEDVLGDGRPAAPSADWPAAQARARQRLAAGGARGGTGTRSAGAVTLDRHQPHQPYSNDSWHTPADPAEAAAVPWCGDLDCDPVTRLRDHDAGNGLKVASLCDKCHPKMQW